MEYLDLFDRANLSRTCRYAYNIFKYRSRVDATGLKWSSAGWEYHDRSKNSVYIFERLCNVKNPGLSYMQGELHVTTAGLFPTILHPCTIVLGNAAICTACYKIYKYWCSATRMIRHYNPCSECNSCNISNNPEEAFVLRLLLSPELLNLL